MNGDLENLTNRDIDRDFEKFIPMIFSHGICTSAKLYHCICGLFASYGYIVFAPDHNDGSNVYT